MDLILGDKELGVPIRNTAQDKHNDRMYELAKRRLEGEEREREEKKERCRQEIERKEKEKRKKMDEMDAHYYNKNPNLSTAETIARGFGRIVVKSEILSVEQLKDLKDREYIAPSVCKFTD